MRVSALLSRLLLIALFHTAAAPAPIWHVQGEQEFYLFGTIHVLKPDTYPLPARYDETLAKCDALWLEADMTELEQPEKAAAAQQLMLLPSGQTLSAQLTPASLAALKALAAEAQVPMAALQQLKPWAAVNALTVMIFQRHGFDVEHGLDLYLQQQASARGIPVRSFETILWQLRMFDQLAAAAGDEFIAFSTEDMDQIDQQVEALYLNWQQGNVDALYQLAAFEAYPQVEAAMLIERNATWMQTLLNLDGFGTQCVAVGALHMAGEQGLLAQFEAAGYRITRLD